METTKRTKINSSLMPVKTKQTMEQFPWKVGMNHARGIGCVLVSTPFDPLQDPIDDRFLCFDTGLPCVHQKRIVEVPLGTSAAPQSAWNMIRKFIESPTPITGSNVAAIIEKV
jgi:hypothetical protein